MVQPQHLHIVPFIIIIIIVTIILLLLLLLLFQKVILVLIQSLVHKSFILMWVYHLWQNEWLFW